MGSTLRIKENYEFLSRNEKKVADYLLEHTEGADLLTVQELASGAGTTLSCVNRFVKKLGYEKYAEFKNDMARQMVREDYLKEELIESVSRSDSVTELVRKMQSFDLNAITETYQNLNTQKLEKAIGMLKHAKKICIIGEGLSQLIGEDLARKFVIMGIDASCPYDSHMQITQVSNLTEEDCLIVLSYSGKSNLPNIALRKAVQKNIPSIAITSSTNSPFAKNAVVTLLIPALEKEYKIGAIVSRFEMVIITDLLYVGTVQDSLDRMYEQAMETRKALSELKEYGKK